jgi:hypothetical protein
MTYLEAKKLKEKNLHIIGGGIKWKSALIGGLINNSIE